MKFPPEPLTVDECRRLIAACSPRCPTGLRNRALIVTLWRGGLRCSESLSLHPRDLDNGVLRVRRGKGGRYRTVALDAEAGPQWSKHGLREKPEWESAVRCSARYAGKPLQRPTFGALFKRLGRKANIAKRVHPHGLAPHLCRRTGRRKG